MCMVGTCTAWRQSLAVDLSPWGDGGICGTYYCDSPHCGFLIGNTLGIWRYHCQLMEAPPLRQDRKIFMIIGLCPRGEEGLREVYSGYWPSRGAQDSEGAGGGAELGAWLVGALSWSGFTSTSATVSGMCSQSRVRLSSSNRMVELIWTSMYPTSSSIWMHQVWRSRDRRQRKCMRIISYYAAQ